MKYKEEFIKYLTYQKKYSPKTIESYETDILEYISFLNENEKDLLKVKYQDISMFIKELSKKNDKATTLSVYFN